MQTESRLADRMLEIMMAGVSTRRYEEVLPDMAQQVGNSKSQVSREFIEAGQ
jgi:putative transposase